MSHEIGYNERLFGGRGLRAAYHTGRYRWVAAEIEKLQLPSPRIIELGCFDAKTLDYLPPDTASYYLGLDAGWEDGLARGMDRWKHQPSVELLKCTAPEEIPERGQFDIGICLETLEHLNDELEDAYLEKLSRVIRGKLFISVPRERGVVFLVKHAAKGILFEPDGAAYSWRDVAMLTRNKPDRVERNEHKGFDDRKLLQIVSRYFNVERVCGLFPTALPVGLNFNIGIVAASKR